MLKITRDGEKPLIMKDNSINHYYQDGNRNG